MSFFFAETKRAKKTGAPSKKAVIPIASLQRAGCTVCPRKADWDDGIKTPQMKPAGHQSPTVYLLGTAPSEKEDRLDEPFVSTAYEEVLSKLPASLRRYSRVGYLTQCKAASKNLMLEMSPDHAEIECCRPRVIADIEETKPIVVIGIGDKALNWALPFSSGVTSITHRGTLFPVKFGTHTCWFYSVMFPAYVHREKRKYPTEYEIALTHDLRNLAKLINNEEIGVPKIYADKWEEGIEIVTGHDAGDFQRVERALADMAALPDVALDIETNGLRPWHLNKPRLWTAAVGTFERVIAFPIDHPDGWGADARIRKMHGLFAEWLWQSRRKWAHNLAMELEWFNWFYSPHAIMGNEWGDTMALAHVLDERKGTKSLEVQTIIGAGFNLKSMSPVDPSLPDWISKYPIKTVLKYNGGDSKWTDFRRRQLQPIVEADEKLHDVYQHKIRMAPALILTEAKGLPVSVPRAEKMNRALTEQLHKIEDKLRADVAVRRHTTQFGQFSPTNSDHVLALMEKTLKRDEIYIIEKDGSESKSVAEEVLALMPEDEVPSAKLILEHRGISKLKSTYLEPVIKGTMISVDGYVHSKYSSLFAATHRLNSEDPNAQNWPKRKHKEVRSIFYAEDDEEILACDYGQIEFRVVGMCSEDDNLCRAVWTGYDVHLHWAERIVALYPKIKDWIRSEFEVDWDEKGIKTLRQEAKNKWVFPQFFGASIKSCAASLHLPEEVAQDLADELWDEFRGVKRWQDKLMESFARKLYVETLDGARRRGPMTKNEIINMPIQGTAARIVQTAHAALAERGFIMDRGVYIPSLNVHDDLSTWSKKAEREANVKIIVEEMCKHRFDWINVPLLVEVSAGPDWSDLTEIGKYSSHELFNIRNPYQ